MYAKIMTAIRELIRGLHEKTQPEGFKNHEI